MEPKAPGFKVTDQHTIKMRTDQLDMLIGIVQELQKDMLLVYHKNDSAKGELSEIEHILKDARQTPDCTF